MRSGSTLTRNRATNKNGPAKRRPGCGNVELLSWRRQLDEPTPTLGTNPTRVPVPPKIPRPARVETWRLGPEGYGAEGSETRAGRNHNRYRPGLGQESWVSGDPFQTPCRIKELSYYPRSRATTACPASAVLQAVPPPAISAVRMPAEMLAATAFSTAADSSCRSSE
jgi:hypothetical protein